MREGLIGRFCLLWRGTGGVFCGVLKRGLKLVAVVMFHGFSTCFVFFRRNGAVRFDLALVRPVDSGVFVVYVVWVALML